MLKLVAIFLFVSQTTFAMNAVWEQDLLPQSESDLPTGNYVKFQTYLEDAPRGVGAHSARTRAGGHGEFVKIYDVETGFNSNRKTSDQRT